MHAMVHFNRSVGLTTKSPARRHGVDATRLTETLQPDHKFDRVVFNFPHHHVCFPSDWRLMAMCPARMPSLST